MRALVSVIGLVGCGSNAPAPAPIASHMSTTEAPATSTGHPQVDESACALSWAEFDPPARIPLVAWGGDLGDECPTFDAPQLLATGACIAPDCIRATVDGRSTAFVMEGPAGSGRFAALGLAVGDSPPRYACAMASTVGWRHLASVARQLAPLPWYADVSGDGRSDLVVWSRLPWGSAESENGLVPVVYALESDALVRHDELGQKVAARVAAAYRSLPATDRNACIDVVATVLEHWGR